MNGVFASNATAYRPSSSAARVKRCAIVAHGWNVTSAGAADHATSCSRFVNARVPVSTVTSLPAKNVVVALSKALVKSEMSSVVSSYPAAPSCTVGWSGDPSAKLTLGA